MPKRHHFQLAVLAALSIGAGLPGKPADAGEITVTKPFTLTLTGNTFNDYQGRWSYGIRAQTANNPAAPVTDQDAKTEVFFPPSANSDAVTAVSGPTTADASASYTAGVVSLNTASGSHTVFEKTNLADGELASTVGTSKLELNAIKRNAQGTITGYDPKVFVSTIQNGKAHDPMYFEMIDLDFGIMRIETLFKLDVELDGPGDFKYEHGLILNAANDGRLFLSLENAGITTGTGRLELIFAGGLVTLSQDSGIFDGLLPGVGASSFFSFTVSGPTGFDIGFDFGGDNTNGYDITLVSEASAELLEVPEPGGSVLFGFGLVVLGLARRAQRRFTWHRR